MFQDVFELNVLEYVFPLIVHPEILYILQSDNVSIHVILTVVDVLFHVEISGEYIIVYVGSTESTLSIWYTDEYVYPFHKSSLALAQIYLFAVVVYEIQVVHVPLELQVKLEFETLYW